MNGDVILGLKHSKAIRKISWSSKSRTEIISKLTQTSFDLIVIGGGITGAGIAREGQLRGLNVALLDKNDFAWGTSSRSTKMAHGGIRYLANGEIRIVRESVTERNWLRVHFPNLVRPITFVFPTYEGGKDGMTTIKFAVRLYGFLGNFRSKFKNYAKYKFLKPEKIADLEPLLLQEKLKGAMQYYETNVDDARLTLESIKEAVVMGATALNYAAVHDYIYNEEKKICGVKFKDIETGNTFEVRGTQIINATGVWVDELLEDFPQTLIRPTKGVHIVYDREDFPLNHAIALRHTGDKRAYFVIPRNDFVLLGTTDTDFSDDLDELYTDYSDWEYLVKSTKHYFPSINLDLDKIISTYAGARPLIMEIGKSESSVSRKHEIIDLPNGLVTSAGGKLTIHRKMAEELILHLRKKRIFPKLSKKKHLSQRPFLIGAERNKWDLEAQKYDFPIDIKDNLYQQYGWGGIEILELARDQPKLAERLHKKRSFIYGEIAYIVDHELPLHVADVLCRRMEVMLRIHPRFQEEIAKNTAEIMADRLNWNNKTKNDEIRQYLDYVDKNSFFLHVKTD